MRKKKRPIVSIQPSPKNSKIYQYLMQRPSGMLMENEEYARKHYLDLFNKLKGNTHPASAEFPYENLMGLDAKLLRIIPYIQLYRYFEPENEDLYFSREDIESFKSFIEKNLSKHSTGEDLLPYFMKENMPTKFEKFKKEIENFEQELERKKQGGGHIKVEISATPRAVCNLLTAGDNQKD